MFGDAGMVFAMLPTARSKPLLLQLVTVNVAEPARSGLVCVSSQSTVNDVFPVTRIGAADAGNADIVSTIATRPSTPNSFITLTSLSTAASGGSRQATARQTPGCRAGCLV